jgi:hypothetical protein
MKFILFGTMLNDLTCKYETNKHTDKQILKINVWAVSLHIKSTELTKDSDYQKSGYKTILKFESL